MLDVLGSRRSSQEAVRTPCTLPLGSSLMLLLSISSDRVRGPLLSFHLHPRGKVSCEGLTANQENALASHRAA